MQYSNRYWLLPAIEVQISMELHLGTWLVLLASENVEDVVAVVNGKLSVFTLRLHFGFEIAPLDSSVVAYDAYSVAVPVGVAADV